MSYNLLGGIGGNIGVSSTNLGLKSGLPGVSSTNLGLATDGLFYPDPGSASAPAPTAPAPPPVQKYYLPNGQEASSAADARAAADTTAYYNDLANQLQGQIGQLDGQQNVGLGNINNSYTKSLNRLDEQNGIAQRDYNTGVQNNSRSYLNTRNNVMQNSRATANALQRLLGINGSGNSSASEEQAPYAVGLQASQNLNGAQQTYAQNGSSLDTQWGDTQRTYKNSQDDLNQQKYSQENGLRSSIAQTRAGLLDKIANAKVQAGVASGNSYQTAAAARQPFQAQIDNLLSQITGLGNQYANPVMRTADVAFKAPDLAQYSLGKFGLAGGQSPQAGAASDLNPTFLNLLTDKDKEQNGGLI